MGLVLLFIYGYFIVSFDWVKIWLVFINKYKCVMFDMLGFGFSDKLLKKYLIKE